MEHLAASAAHKLIALVFFCLFFFFQFWGLILGLHLPEDNILPTAGLFCSSADDKAESSGQ